MKYIYTLTALLLLGGFALWTSFQAEDTEDLPNVVLIFADDMGYQDVQCFGAPDIKTPHLDQLAADGARFTNFHVGQAVCSASRAALMTGCYPTRVSIRGAFGPNSARGLHPDEVTMAEIFKQKGYATAIYGKWHLGDQPEFLPTRQGFDEYFGIPYSNDMWPYHPQRPNGYPPLPLYEQEDRIDTLEEQSMLTTWLTERAVDFINRKKDEPFFLYVPHPMPHVPLFVSDKFKGKSERGLYGDVIQEIDWSVGQIRQALEDNGVADNTVIIFTSDNGPWLSYGEHSGRALPLREGKGTAWEGGMRVPCIMHWPGVIPEGLEVDEPAMTIDLLPTLANYVGAELPGHIIDGKDILPLMKGERGATSPHEAYFVYYKDRELHAVLQGDWKLYLPHEYRSLEGRLGGKGGMPTYYNNRMKTGVELYNLEQDISERHDVAEQHPEIVAELLALAEKCRKDMGDNLTGVTGENVREAGVVEVEQ